MRIKYYKYSNLIINDEDKTCRMEIDEAWERSSQDDKDRIQGTFKDCMQEYQLLMREGYTEPIQVG